MLPPSLVSVHNFYRQPGGEDQIFAAESDLFERKGHSVIRYQEHNEQINRGNVVSTGIKTMWNRESYRRLESVARAHRPDVAHFQNTFPLISPAAYYAVRRQGVAAVQTLHNFRLLCAGATFYREGRPCEACVESWAPWRGVAHGCYRGSRAASLAVASMIGFHRARGTWTTMVDLFVAGSTFAREKFISGGLPAEKIVVKSNFLYPDPGVGTGAGGYALFVGRLADEKGVRTLLDAWGKLPQIPLRIAGSGPLTSFRSLPNVTWLGQRTHHEVIAEMQQAHVLVFPSLWYEMAPLTILQAFATGLPVIASNIGVMTEQVRHRHNGLHFTPGDPEDLSRQVRWAFEHPEEIRSMRAAARREFEDKYTAERNYKMLLEIYGMAIENARRERRAAS
jgi:glycosyltransferase involved in cell wall biosynthesis